MYAGYGSGEQYIEDKEEENVKANIPYIGFNYGEMWIGESALKGIVRFGESFRSYAIKVLFIMTFLTVLRASYGVL